MSYTIIPMSIEVLPNGFIMLKMNNIIQKRAMWRVGHIIKSCGGGKFEINKIGLNYYIVEPLTEYNGEKVFYGLYPKKVV